MQRKKHKEMLSLIGKDYTGPDQSGYGGYIPRDVECNGTNVRSVCKATQPLWQMHKFLLIKSALISDMHHAVITAIRKSKDNQNQKVAVPSQGGQRFQIVKAQHVGANEITIFIPECYLTWIENPMFMIEQHNTKLNCRNYVYNMTLCRLNSPSWPLRLPQLSLQKALSRHYGLQLPSSMIPGYDENYNPKTS